MAEGLPGVMAVAEQYTQTDRQENMPIPGRLRHLEWLSQLEVPERISLEELRGFLDYTQAVNSFVRFTRQHRMVPHMPRRHRLEFDTRLMKNLGPDWQQIFRCSVEISPEIHDRGLLVIHGQPQPEAPPDENYTYDLVLPVKDHKYHDPSYDPARPIEAMYSWHQQEKFTDHKRVAFTEIARYNQGEPAVVAHALQEAARTACDLYRYMYGEDMVLPPPQPSSPELAQWHPHYLADDPNEFLKQA